MLVNDLSMKPGEVLLVENDVVFQLASEGRNPLFQRQNLFVDDQENAMLMRRGIRGEF
jgi:hypothetical protein